MTKKIGQNASIFRCYIWLHVIRYVRYDYICENKSRCNFIVGIFNILQLVIYFLTLLIHTYEKTCVISPLISRDKFSSEQIPFNHIHQNSSLEARLVYHKKILCFLQFYYKDRIYWQDVYPLKAIVYLEMKRPLQCVSVHSSFAL